MHFEVFARHNTGEPRIRNKSSTEIIVWKMARSTPYHVKPLQEKSEEYGFMRSGVS
jgi:hypothetical protein